MEDMTNQTDDPNSLRGVRYSQDVTTALITIAVLFIVLGVFGNGLIIVSVLIDKTLRTIPNVFIIILAVADITILGYILPFSVLDLLRNQYPVGRTFCKINAFVLLYSHGISNWSLAFLAICRYVQICHFAKRSIWLCKRNIVVAVIAVALIPAPVNVAHFFGFGSLGYNAKLHMCFIRNNDNSMAQMTQMMVRLAFPSCVVLVLYILTLRKIRSIRRRVRNVFKNHLLASSAVNRKLQMNLNSTLFVTFAVSLLLTWVIPLVGSLFDTDNTWPPSFSITGVYLVLANSCINWIIYGAMNSHFRDTYKKLLCHFRSRNFGNNVEIIHL